MMQVVERIEPDVDPRDVLCTTYQMRNCFRQFFDGVASELDVHCYFQHAFAADLCPKSGRVLDVCCGRGLLIQAFRVGCAHEDEQSGTDANGASKALTIQARRLRSRWAGRPKMQARRLRSRWAGRPKMRARRLRSRWAGRPKMQARRLCSRWARRPERSGAPSGMHE